jgi:hypothetical protein
MLCDKSMSLKLKNIFVITIYWLFKGTPHRRSTLRRIAREACKEMEQETMSFRFIYLKQAMDR